MIVSEKQISRQSLT